MIQVVPSTVEHAKYLSMHLREKDKEEARALGLYPHRGVFYAYKHACYRKTALVDGVVAAMWGLHGELLSSVGHPYLITGTEVEKVSPLVFARVYIREVQDMLTFFPVLENLVDARYTEACRMLELAGFSFEGPFVVNQNQFYKFKLEATS